MSRVLFLCGPSGSGKTTYARGLEQRGMVRLSFDVEAWHRGVSASAAPQHELQEVDRALRARLLALVGAGRDVVVDLSFSTRAVREDYRRLLLPVGILPETVFFATDRETVLARMRARRGEHADSVVLTPEAAARHFDDFERPTPEEGPLTIVEG